MKSRVSEKEYTMLWEYIIPADIYCNTAFHRFLTIRKCCAFITLTQKLVIDKTCSIRVISMSTL